MKTDRMRRFYLCGLAAIVMIPAAAFPQFGRNIVSGFVYGPNRTPVPDVHVELNTEVGSPISRTRTDGSGRYSFRGVPFGRLSIRVLPLATDLSEQTQQFQIGNVGARGQLIPDNLQIDFYLRPRRTPPRSTTGVVFAQDIPVEARRRYDLAIEHFENKQTSDGIEELKNAIGIFPTYFVALERLGTEYMKLQKYEEARNVYEQAAAVNPRSFNSLYGLAHSSFVLERYDAALEAVNKALIENKNSPGALFLLGVTQRKLQQYEAAEKSLLDAKKRDKGRTPEIIWNLALLYAHNLKKYDKAADELEDYLKLEPADPNSANIRKLIQRLRSGLPPQ
jgi:tetratricopeptide (TPR) repeat protein